MCAYDLRPTFCTQLRGLIHLQVIDQSCIFYCRHFSDSSEHQFCVNREVLASRKHEHKHRYAFNYETVTQAIFEKL